MMKFPMEEYCKRITTLNKEIDTIYGRLEAFTEYPSFRDQEETIRSHLDLLVKEIVTTKEHTFWRDKTAFCEGKAYKWHQRNTQTRNTANHRRINIDKGSNFS